MTEEEFKAEVTNFASAANVRMKDSMVVVLWEKMQGYSIEEFRKIVSKLIETRETIPRNVIAMFVMEGQAIRLHQRKYERIEAPAVPVTEDESRIYAAWPSDRCEEACQWLEQCQPGPAKIIDMARNRMDPERFRVFRNRTGALFLERHHGTIPEVVVKTAEDVGARALLRNEPVRSNRTVRLGTEALSGAPRPRKMSFEEWKRRKEREGMDTDSSAQPRG
jgi:hypothetical protein